MTRISIILIFLLLLLSSCTNPFAPGLSDIKTASSVIADQKEVEGVFKNFTYAYNFRDTTVYGNLLNNDFTFSFEDKDNGSDVYWGRDEDMLITNRLFQSVQNIDLVWNEVLISSGDTTRQEIKRSFTLTITFSPADISIVQGKAYFILTRKTTLENWTISKWIDDAI